MKRGVFSLPTCRPSRAGKSPEAFSPRCRSELRPHPPTPCLLLHGACHFVPPPLSFITLIPFRFARTLTTLARTLRLLSLGPSSGLRYSDAQARALSPTDPPSKAVRLASGVAQLPRGQARELARKATEEEGGILSPYLPPLARGQVIRGLLASLPLGVETPKCFFFLHPHHRPSGGLRL